MNEEKLLKFHEMWSNTKGIMIPRMWAYNICNPDPAVPYDDKDTTGMLIGSLLANIFELYGFPQDANNMYPILNELILTKKQMLIDKSKLMKSLGALSENEIDEALDRAARWSLITISKHNKNLYCTLTKESIDNEHCQKIRTLNKEKINMYESK